MTTIPRRATRPAAVATTALAVSLLAAACGGGTTAAGPSGTVGSAPATSPGSSAPAATTPAGYQSAITDQVVDNPAFDRLTGEIARRTTAAGLPGSSLLVLQDGKLVEQQALGGYDLSTVVPIASASKWLSGVTIMSLVDDGLIELDAPISTYLPDATGRSGRITMRQLLSFTSGLEYDERIPCYQDLAKTLAQCATEILALPLLDEPGHGYRYTGTHLFVAAAVAEAVTGKTWEEIFQERVARPLHMDHTTFVGGFHTVGGAADGHPAPAGSAFSTLGDYGRFLEMLVHDGVAPDGTRSLSPAAIAEMGRNQIADAKFVSAASGRKANETPYGLAHWLDVTAPDGTALVESSPGKFGFRPWIDHENHIAGVHLIVDKNDEHVADSPDREGGPGDPSVQTSGNWVLVETAKALGGTVPDKRGR